MLKIGAGVLGADAVATGGVFIYKGLSKPQTHSIKSLLASKNPEKRLMSKSSDGSEDYGKKAWKAYLDSKNNIGNLKEGKETPASSENAPVSFMDTCVSNSNSMVESVSSRDYLNILSFCTRDTLVKDLVLESGRVLNDANNGGGSESWKNYRSVNTGKENNQDTGQLTDGSSKKSSDSTISENLKVQCGTKLDSKSGVKSVNDYRDVVTGCSKPKG